MQRKPTPRRRASSVDSTMMEMMVAICVEIKIYGAFVLNHRVNLHAIDATPAG